MPAWRDFETQCVEYLNDTFGDYAEFIGQGGADSTVPDILVITNSGEKFYIEAKHTPAQCGQFVLLPDVATQTFVYSHRNNSPCNRYADRIIRHMNNDFEVYKEAGTRGVEIDLDDKGETFSKWIVNYYQNKGVRFFITNNFVILPIEDFAEFFDVSATYRVKRSGSTNVGTSNIMRITRFIENNGYDIFDIRHENDKLFVSSQANLHNVRFISNGVEYMFSRRDDEYEIRKLSNTFNANVIFSIDCICNQGLSNNEFICEL